MEDKIITAENEVNFYDKDNPKKCENNKFSYINRQSSDLTSASSTTSETFSQTSEILYLPLYYIIKPIKRQNFFDEIIDYFKKTEPEKFHDYKKSKNFLPKMKKEKVKEFNCENTNNINIVNSNSNNNQNNKVNNNYYVQIGNNTYNNIYNGNVIYYVYNNFYFYYPVNKLQTGKEKNINKDIEIKKDKDVEKEGNKNNKEEKEEIKEEREKNDIEIIYVGKKTEKNRDMFDEKNYNKKKDNIYYKKNYNNEKKDDDKEFFDDYKYRNRKDYYLYNEPIDDRIYPNKYRGKYELYERYNKFNGNFGGRRKKFFDENNFYKRKYYQ